MQTASQLSHCSRYSNDAARQESREDAQAPLAMADRKLRDVNSQMRWQQERQRPAEAAKKLTAENERKRRAAREREKTRSDHRELDPQLGCKLGFTSVRSHLTVEAGLWGLIVQYRVGLSTFLCFFAFGCVATPPMAPDISLPLKAIVLHATCELRDALAAFQRPPPGERLPPRFPEHWSMSIQLTPKVDTDFNARVGLTGTTKGPGDKKTYFNAFSIAGPGAGADVKTWKSGAVTYYVSGHDLLNTALPRIDCTDARSTLHALAQDFGIHDWLRRLIDSANQNQLKGLVTFDKPTFGAELTIRLDGTGNFTYNFPLGTDFGSVGGWYEVDTILSIAFTPDPKPAPEPVQFPSLPKAKGTPLSEEFTTFRENANPSFRPAPRIRQPRRVAPSAAPQGVSPEAKERLDSQQFEQTLRNLQFNR